MGFSAFVKKSIIIRSNGREIRIPGNPLDLNLEFDNYNSKFAFLNASITPYGRNSRLHQRNCVCAVLESLDAIYETNYFSPKKRIWTTPHNVQSFAKNFQAKYIYPNTSPKTRLGWGAGILSVAALGVGSIYGYDKLKLTSDSSTKYDSNCVLNEQRRFSERIDGIYNVINQYRTELNLFKYFVLEKTSDYRK